MVSFVTSTTGKENWRNENGQIQLNEGNSYVGKPWQSQNKRKYTSVYKVRKRRDAWDGGSPIETDAPDCHLPPQSNPTHTPWKKNDDNHPEGVIGAKSGVCSMDTAAGIANIPISGAPGSQRGAASSLLTTRTIVCTSSTPGNVPIMEKMEAWSCEGTMREGLGSLGKGPGNGQDSLPRWLGRQTGERERVFTPQSGKGPDEDRDTSTRWMERWGLEQTIGVAGSVTETETGRRVGGGVDWLDDSRLNFRSRLGPRPSTGGDVTIA